MARVILALLLLLTFCGCKAKSPAPTTQFAIDRANNAATPAPLNFLHKAFSMSGSARFPFTVPAHQLNPRLQGSFRVFASSAQPQAGVDMMVLNEEQFNEFASGNGGAATYSVEDSPGQSIDLALPPTVRNPVNYYLIFQNAKPRKATKVQADFTVAF